MEASISSIPRAQAFWDRYLTILNVNRLPERYQPWYQKHVEQFIAFQPGDHLVQRSTEDVQNWLQSPGHQPQIADWRFRQKADAVRLLYGQLLKPEWAGRS
jgi:hypothetical protein